jgi:hypothetical protein
MNRFFSSLFVERQNSPKRGARAARNGSHRRRQFHLGVECMEGRQLMSGTTLTAVPIGTLHIAMTADVNQQAMDAVLDSNVVVSQQPGAGQLELPTSYPYYVQINGEVMEVTQEPEEAIPGDGNEYNFNPVVRAADGTNVASHAVGQTVSWLDGYLPATHLGAPTGFEAKTVSTSQINLTWNGVVGERGYQVEMWKSSTTAAPTVINLGAATPLEYSVTSLSAGTTYFFKIAAVNDDGVGDFTSFVNATTTAAPAAPPVAPPKPTLPVAPTGLTATPVSTSQINLSWRGVTNATGYVIYEYEGGAWQRIGTTTGTAYSVPGLSADTTYWFDVAASNAAGTSAGATPASATTLKLLQVPGAPTNLAARAASSTQINLSWTGVSGATGYVVYKYTSSGWQNIGTITGTSCAVPSPSSGTGYYFAVAAYNAAGTGASSTVAYGLTTPAAPAFKAQAVTTSEVQLSWSPVTGATGYLVEMDVNGAWKQIGNPFSASTSSCLVTELGVGTYYFEVVAFNSSGVGAYPMWQTATT